MSDTQNRLVLGPAITRRGVMAGAAAGAACRSLGRARAATVGTIIVGSNGWLYPVWEKVQEVDFKTVDRVTPIIGGVCKQLKAAGIETAITLMPIRGRVYPQFLPADAKLADGPAKRYGYGLAQITAQGIVAPDYATLFSTWASQPAPAGGSADAGFVPVGADLFFKADSHWATPASLPSATELAKQIKAGIQLPAAPGAGSQLGDAVKTLQEKNDLAELLPPAMQPQYPFESYMLPQAAGATGDDALITADAADTVVIGNSYMQPKYGFSSQLSSDLGRPVSLFWKIDRFGPFATLIAYLKSDLFKSQRPKLIVWNIRETQLEHLPDDDDFYSQNAISAPDLTAAIKAALA